MTDILNGIGDVHYEAAKDALAKQDSSSDKWAPVRSAVTHLEAAHVAYKRIHQSHRHFRVVTWKIAGFKDVWTLALMATCYIYLREWKLAQQTAHQAEEVLWHVRHPPRNSGITSGGGHGPANRAPEDLDPLLTLFNPVEWFRLPSLVSYWMGDEEDAALKAFSHAIRTNFPGESR